MVLRIALLTISIVILVGVAVFTYVSLREQEPRAPKIGAAGIAAQSVLTLAVIFVPEVRMPLA